MLYTISQRCDFCRACLDICPDKAIFIEESAKTVHIKEELCSLCYRCLNICDNKVFNFSPSSFIRKEVVRNYIAAVCIDPFISHSLSPSSKELINYTQKLCEKYYKSAIITTSSIKYKEKLEEEISRYGVEEVYIITIEDKFIKEINLAVDNDLILPTLIKILKEIKPYLLLFSSWRSLKPLAGRLAAALATGFTSECSLIKLKEKIKNYNDSYLEEIKPAGEDYVATIITPNHRPIIASLLLLDSSFQTQEINYSPKINYFPISSDFAESKLQIRKITKKEEKDEIPLEEASIVVCAGMGIGKRENLNSLKELAHILGAELGATRPVVELGWLPKSCLIGQSGKKINPDLYLGFGVSGALPHIIGIRRAKCIVAINNNPEAPIFNYANYGIVADLNEFIPTLIEELKNQSSL
jgi:electron transfer flavoprotein alpha subunit